MDAETLARGDHLVGPAVPRPAQSVRPGELHTSEELFDEPVQADIVRAQATGVVSGTLSVGRSLQEQPVTSGDVREGGEVAPFAPSGTAYWHWRLCYRPEWTG